MTLAPLKHRQLEFEDIDGVVEALRRQGYRLSAARRIVLEALFAAEGPVSAEFIADGLGGSVRRSDLASVYRNLEWLETLGVVRHVHLGHGPGLYTLARDGAREYLVCERCGRVESVEPAALDAIRGQLKEAFGFEARFSHFAIPGLCGGCAAAVGSGDVADEGPASAGTGGRSRRRGSTAARDSHDVPHSHGHYVHSHAHEHGDGHGH
jgi:Fur family transcriptional regulator, ferric uptake regulator